MIEKPMKRVKRNNASLYEPGNLGNDRLDKEKKSMRTEKGE